MPAPRLTPELIAAAVEGYESQKARIDLKIAELKALLPGGPAIAAAAPEALARKRKVSAAARRKMAIAQKRRWAAIKGGRTPSPRSIWQSTSPRAQRNSGACQQTRWQQPMIAAAKASKPKRKISKEGLARIVAATKKRWAAVRAAKAQQQKAAAKKPAKKKAVKRTANKAAAPVVAHAAG